MAQLAIAAAGAAVGSVFGPVGAQVGWAIGSVVGAQFGPKQKSYGPRLEDLKVTGSEYGQTIPWAAGHPRIAGQVWWASQRREIGTTTSAGKGGGGAESTSYTYEVDILYGLSSRSGGRVCRVFLNGKLVWTELGSSSAASLAASKTDAPWDRITSYSGSSGQIPDPTYEAVVTNAPAYRGRTSVFIEGLQLGNSGVIPNLTFEIAFDYDEGQGLGPEAPYTPSTPYSVSGWDAELFTPISGGFYFSPYQTESSFSNIITYEDVGTELDMSGNFSIEFDFNPDTVAAAAGTTDATAVVVGQVVVTATDYVGTHTISDDWYIRYIAPDELQLRNVGSVSGSGPNLPVTYGEWHNYRWDRLGDQIKCYVDDVLTTTVTYTSPVTDITSSQKLTFNGPYQTYAPVPNTWNNGMSIRNFLFRPGQETVSPNNETLRSVVEALCDIAGLEGTQFDASDLDAITKPVRGFVVSQVATTRSALEQLMAAYFFEAYVSDKLYFVPRASSVSDAIEADDLGTGLEGPDEETLPTMIGNALEIPMQVAISYSNVDADYTTATEHSDRLV